MINFIPRNIFKEIFSKFYIKLNGDFMVKKRIIIILNIENKKILSDCIEKYNLIPAGHTELLSRKPIGCLDQNKFIVDLAVIPEIQMFITELEELGFKPEFEDVDAHEEIIF